MTVISLQRLPLGFRFNPTDEELINHYLKRKINGRSKSDIEVIGEIDVCKCEPWDLPAKSLIQSDDNRWYFFAPKDRKYPNGQRSNRATEAGYWKATGKDRTIRAKGARSKNAVIGTKKTLVFHCGRAPKGARTCWIMHEYRTTEPEFESRDQGGYVLYLLFKKDENCSSSNAEEIETGGSPPTPSKSSLSDTQHETDATEEVENSMNHESPKSLMQEGPKASVENHPTGISKWLDKTSDHLASYPVNPCSNLSKDGHDAKTEKMAGPLQDVSTHISDFVYEQPNDNAFPNISSPMLHYLDHPFLGSNNQGSDVGLFPEDNAEWASLDDLINSEMFKDMFPSDTYIQDDSVTANELVNGIWDSGSCKDSVSSGEIDAESRSAQLKLLQRAGDMESHKLSYDMPSLPTGFMQMDTSVRYSLQSSLYQDLSPLPIDSIAPDVYSVGSASESLQDLLSNTDESYYQKNTASDGEGAVIEIRSRRSQHPLNPDHDPIQQGNTRRRLRLQCLVHNTLDSSAIKERETETITREIKQQEELNKYLANEETATLPESLSSVNSDSGGDDKYEDEEEAEHVDDNFTETGDASRPPQVDKPVEPKTRDETPVSSDVYQQPKSEIMIRRRSDTGDQTHKVSSLPLNRPRKSSASAYVIRRVLLAVLVVVLCGGIYVVVV